MPSDASSSSLLAAQDCRIGDRGASAIAHALAAEAEAEAEVEARR